MKTGLIYTLSDPTTEFVRYVGQTTVKPENRYAHHIFQWKRSIGKISHVNSWIKSLSISGLKPVMNIIEDSIPLEKLDSQEIDYIKLYKSIGAPLCNHTVGGRGSTGSKVSKESIEKRLNTLKTSILWKERGKRHSEIMKKLHASGQVKFAHKPDHLKLPKKLRSYAKRNFKRPVASVIISGLVIDKVFNNASEAGKYYGIYRSQISKMCNGEYKYDNIKGKTFKYLSDMLKV